MSSTGTHSLAAISMTRDFGPTRALDGASLELVPGEVHALLGENGAGKSTLVKILVGADKPDGGVVRCQGVEVEFDGVSDAIDHGIVPIYQQLSLMPHLTVTENLFAFRLAAGRAWSRVDKRWGSKAQEALGAVGLDVRHDTRVGDLSLAERQLVEIARSLVVDCQVLVLDEPTTALTASEIEHLFSVVRNLRDRGRAVLFISHQVDEVLEISDRISVLRGGRSEIVGCPVEDLTGDDIIRAMVGRDVDTTAFASGTRGEAILEARELTAAGLLHRISLTAHRGEVLAVVGILGSGALDLAEALAGDRHAEGFVTVDKTSVRPGNRRAALAAGIGYVPGDRDRDGVFPTLTVLDNGSASVLDRLGPRGMVVKARARKILQPILKRLSTKPAGTNSAVTALSGGNQQKVMLARALLRDDTKVLVVVEPSRGVDVGSRRDIHHAIHQFAANGAAVVMASTDLDEVAMLADRVIVMRHGHIAAEVTGVISVERLLAQMTGASS